MSLGGHGDGRAGAASLAGPPSAEWGASSAFADDLLGLDGNFDEPLRLTAEEERLFRSFGDGLGSFSSPFDSGSDPIDERQVVFAEAAAAGVFKGGIRRAAFSMGDLQAFQLPDPGPAPPSPRAHLPARGSGGGGPGASKPPRLASVPEAKVLRGPGGLPPASGSAGLLDDMLLSSRVSGLSMGGEGGLDGLGLDGLSAGLLGGSGGGSNPFEADVPMPLFGHPASQPGGPPLPAVKPEPGLSLPPLGPQLGLSAGLPSSGGLFDFRPGGGSCDRKPPLSPASSGFPPPTSAAALSLQGYADELLKKAMPPLPQPAAKREAAEAPPEAAAQQQKQQQRERMMRRSQSAVELRGAGRGLPSGEPDGSPGGSGELGRRQFMVELTTPDGHTYTAGRLSQEERAQKILRYRQKRHERNFNKRIKYMCRKTLADSRPRVRGRFARNDDAAAVLPHETKKAQAERRKREAASKKAAAGAARKSGAQQAAATLLDASELAADFPGLLADEAISGGGGSGLLPGSEAYDFPPVPMELYSSIGSSSTHFKPGSL